MTPSGEGCVIALNGALDERADPASIVARPASHVMFDLDGVERVTSYGVIVWLAALKALDGKQYAFARCRPSIVRQLNMVTGFGRRGQVISVYLPYFCATCDDDHERLLDLTLDFSPVAKREPPLFECPECGHPCEFDEAPDTYFEFGNDYTEPRLSPTMYKLLRLVGKEAKTTLIPADIDTQQLRTQRDDLRATTERLAKHRGHRDS